MKSRAVWEIPHRLEVTEGPVCLMRSCQVSPDTLSTMWPTTCSPHSVDVHQGLGTAQPVRLTGHSRPQALRLGDAGLQLPSVAGSNIDRAGRAKILDLGSREDPGQHHLDRSPEEGAWQVAFLPQATGRQGQPDLAGGAAYLWPLQRAQGRMGAADVWDGRWD